jgi:ABC-type transport system involved in cytochrome bd biosynthesis fused ATPase/permease subunit
LIIRLVTRQRLRQNSAAIQRLAPVSSSIVQNAVRGFLELITFRAVGSVQRTYLNRTRELYRVHSRQMVLGIVPTRLYEFLAVTALCAIIVASLWVGESDAAFFETLSLLALSAYRVMPAMSRVNARLIAMRGQMHLLAAMEGAGEKAEESAGTSPHTLAGPINLQVRDLTLGYKGGVPVIEGLNATFESGRIHTITGASGSGKSTLISSLLGLHAPASGEVLIEGRALGGGLATADWLGSVAYLSQHPFLFAGTIRENLTLGANAQNLDEAGALELIQQLGLTEALGASPLDFQLYEGGSNLSGGQQQRLALIRALRLERPVLILDEATSGLDRTSRDAVLAVLHTYAAAQRMVLLVTHDEEVQAKYPGLRLDSWNPSPNGAS